jgi:hypothetical protein
MAKIIVSKSTKEQMLAAAHSGKVIEGWMNQFIRTDSEFQKELFCVAENAKNWRFIDKLIDFRDAQRNAFANAKANATKQKQKPPKRTPHKYVFKKTPKEPPLDPRTLPPNLVQTVSKKDFANCPECGLHLLEKALHDHLEISCPNRGKKNIPSDDEGRKILEVNGMTLCRAVNCNAFAIPGDMYCNDHKHN